ncbi:uncharacterized protein LOC135843352 isoform X2 [Planococcus citri]|uniref:uncharacterized protein LOC135843352 isoform X2 n=1 Tax=Planococcus citri TaxID=170843 RepID=UPI0031F8D9AF
MSLLNNFSKEESARRVHKIDCCHSASHQFTNHYSRQFPDDPCPSGFRSEPYEIETEIDELFMKDKDVCIVCGYVSANEFFSFPSDVDTRQQWATFCDLAFDMIKPHFRLCDRHFKPDDYRIAIQRKLLIPMSVPTLLPKLKPGCASSINNSLQSSLNTIDIFNQTFDKNTSKNSMYSPVFQSNMLNTTDDALNKQFRRIFGGITNNYNDDVPSMTKKLAWKRKLKVEQGRQQTKCFRSEIFRLKTRCSRLEDTVAELRKRIERLDERCFVAPAEIDRNIAEDTRDRRLAIHSPETLEDSSCTTEALPTKHYEKVAFVETAVNDVEVTHPHQSKSSDDPCNTMTRLSGLQQHSEKDPTASTEISGNVAEVICNSNLPMFPEVECMDSLSIADAAQPEDHLKKVALIESMGKVADEDGYFTDLSMATIEISSDDLHTSEEPLEQFSEEALLVEFIEKVTEDYHSSESFILPLGISSDDHQDSEEQPEQFPDEVALVEAAQNIVKDVGNTNLSTFLGGKSNDGCDTDTAPEQYSEADAYVEHVNEDNQFPNLTAVSPQKLNDNSPCNAEAQSQQRSEEVDPASEDLRGCFSDPTKATDYVFFNVLLDDNEVVSGISVSPQINCQLRRNDTSANSKNELFDTGHVGQTLHMEQVQVTTQLPNYNDELNVCQRNGQACPLAGCSKHRKNGDVGRITRSAKKKKDLPSVATSIQTSDSVPKKVRGVLTRDSPPYYCNICDKTFSVKRYWRRHQQGHSKPFVCPKCKKPFATKYRLIRHQAAHSYKKPYKCGICDTRFKHNDTKLHHERYKHTEVACFQCAVCGKMINNKNFIIHHLLVHSDQKLFRCQTCGTSFSDKSTLVVHQGTHSRKKNFKCRICNKRFKYQKAMARHERLHEGPRFECSLCGKKYRQKQGLTYHLSHSCSYITIISF